MKNSSPPPFPFPHGYAALLSHLPVSGEQDCQITKLRKWNFKGAGCADEAEVAGLLRGLVHFGVRAKSGRNLGILVFFF